MKKGLIVLLILILVVGAFFAGTLTKENIIKNVDTETNNDSSTASTIEYNANNAKVTDISTTTTTFPETEFYEEYDVSASELTGVWWFYDDRYSVGQVLSFNEMNEVYFITLQDSKVIDYRKFIYENSDGYIKFIADLNIRELSEDELLQVLPYTVIMSTSIHHSGYMSNYITVDEFEKCTYSIDSNKLILNECEYTKKNIEYNSLKSIIGTWKFFNGYYMPFKLVDLYIDVETIDFFGDGTFSFVSEISSIENGEYTVVHDGRAIELKRDAWRYDIYKFELVGNGLIMLSCAGNGNSSNDLDEYYCLLEQIA